MRYVILAGLLALAPQQETLRVPSGSILLVLNKSESMLEALDPAQGAIVGRARTGLGPHEVAVSDDGTLAAVGNYGKSADGNSVTVYDVRTLKIKKNIELGENRKPHGLQFLDAERLLVTTEATKSVQIISIVTGEIEKSIETGGEASHMIALTVDRTRAFVPNIGSDNVSVLDLKSGEVVQHVQVGKQPEGIAAHPNGREIWVANRAADEIAVIDVDSLEVTARVSTGSFPIRVAFTPDGKHLLSSNAGSGDVSLIDTTTRKEVERIPLGIEALEERKGRLFGGAFGASAVPIGLVVDPSGSYAFVALSQADKVAAIDLKKRVVVAAFETGEEPDGLAWSVAGGSGPR